MSLEEITQYMAFCDGPSDLPVGKGCPSDARYADDAGDDRYYDDSSLAAEMAKDGWYVEMTRHPGGDYPRRFGEVMCPDCKEAAGE